MDRLPEALLGWRLPYGAFMTLLSTRALCKRFEKQEVLKRIDFSLREGEQVALLGPSGSGKSTFLHLLGGLDQPNSGEIIFRGHSLQRMSRKQLAKFRRDHLGTVFQFFHLLPSLTAAENVALPLRIKGWGESQIRERVQYLLQRIGLTGRGHALPAELSGGEMQRIAVARGIAMRPILVLADEPTGNLDKAAGREVLDLFFELTRDEGAAVFMVTHSQEAAQRFGRVLWMEDGCLRATVPPHLAMP